MLQYASAWLVLVLLLLLGLANLQRLFPFLELPRPTAAPTQPKAPRPLRPRSPDDCPACRETIPPPPPTTTSPIPPWRTAKSRGGRHKTIDTEGYACPNPDCEYYGLTDAKVHALIGYGHHGQREPSQDLYCQACHRKFSLP